MAEQPSPHYRNDLWTLDDRLGLGRAGDEVARMVLEVEPPFTLGVTGKWGAGKTSVMRQAFVTLGGQPIKQERMLAEPGEEERATTWQMRHWNNRKDELGWPEAYYPWLDGVLCVWFSPWQHQNETNPLIPLVKEIQAQFEATLTTESRWYKKSKKALGTLNRRGGLAGAKLLEHVADAAVSLVAQRPASLAKGMTDAIRQGWNEAEPYLAAMSDGQRFHLMFEDAVDEVLTAIREQFTGDTGKVAEQSRLVIFIDDLDRCEEEVIVRLLEAIKLYLSSRRCVFVLGLDDGAVLEALGRYWKRSDDSNREYLEKLFQCILAVPLPGPANVRDSIQGQLDKHGIPHARKLVEDIDRLIEPNPRKLKNFVNGFCATWQLHSTGDWATTEDEARRFLLFHYLRLYHRPVWRLLERQPWSLAILHAVVTGKGLPEAAALPEEVDQSQQRLLREYYFRAFSHVLGHTGGEADETHGTEPLASAVEHFQQRQDRKRSDEYLCRLIKELVKAGQSLDDRHLYLAPRQPGAAAQP
jgi:hypothetical protein